MQRWNGRARESSELNGYLISSPNARRMPHRPRALPLAACAVPCRRRATVTWRYIEPRRPAHVVWAGVTPWRRAWPQRDGAAARVPTPCGLCGALWACGGWVRVIQPKLLCICINLCFILIVHMSYNTEILIARASVAKRTTRRTVATQRTPRTVRTATRELARRAGHRCNRI